MFLSCLLLLALLEAKSQTTKVASTGSAVHLIADQRARDAEAV